MCIFSSSIVSIFMSLNSDYPFKKLRNIFLTIWQSCYLLHSADKSIPIPTAVVAEQVVDKGVDCVKFLVVTQELPKALQLFWTHLNIGAFVSHEHTTLFQNVRTRVFNHYIVPYLQVSMEVLQDPVNVGMCIFNEHPRMGKGFEKFVTKGFLNLVRVALKEGYIFWL